jgi:membrane protease YdiL (CAAX protease family)
LFEQSGKTVSAVCDKGLKETIKKALLFVLITDFTTWILWYGAFKWLSGLRIVGSFIPSLVGTIFIIKDHTVEKRLLSAKFQPKMIAFILSYSFLSLWISYMLAKLLGFNPGRFIITNSVGEIPVYNISSLFMVTLLVLVAGGPLGEEIGWRGYLMQRLEKSFDPIAAAVLTGVCWAVWHIPMFAFNVEGYNISFFVYLIQTINLSVITGWVFKKSGQNIIAAILFHTIDNLVLSLCFQPSLNETNIYTVLYWLFQLATGAFCAFDLRLKKRRGAKH